MTTTAKDWIQTYPSGRQFRPLNPDPADILIEDIAHHLAHICRYTGAVARFYSVAEHSVYVSMCVPQRDALAGLLHDSAEAYLNDIATPVKRSPELAGYRGAEDRLLAMILERFGLPPELPKSVAIADGRMLATEAPALKAPLHPDWRMAWAPYDIPPESLGMTPKQARRAFLRRFHQLTKGDT